MESSARILPGTALCLLLALAVLPAPAAAQTAATVPDTDWEGFEGDDQPVLLLSGDGTPPAASLSITHDPARVHAGSAALEFAYDRLTGPLPVLVHPVLMTDLVALRFWALSEQDATWVMLHEDRDGARFLATVYLPAGQWVAVDLAPEDFPIDPASPVQKPAMEPERNGMHWFGFDLASISGPAGPNRVWFDDLEVERPPLRFLAGPLVVGGQAWITIRRPTWIDGDLVVADGGSFTSTASRLVVNGNIGSFESGSRAVFRGGTLRLNAGYRYQRDLQVMKGALLRLQDLLFAPGEMTGLGVARNGTCEILGTVFPGPSFTAGLSQGGRLVVRRSDNPGEFLPGPGTEMVVEDSRGVLTWLVAEEGRVADLSVPAGTPVTWSLPPAWGRTVQLTNVEDALFGLIAEEGCDLVVRDSVLRAAGLLFRTTQPVLDGYQNQSSYGAVTFPLPATGLRFENVTVQSWNFYATDTARVTVRNALFGEGLAFGQGVLKVAHSTCDGSGGYLGARDRGRVLLTGSDALCEIVCDGDSALGMKNGTVSGSVTAAGNALIGFQGCTLEGPLHELENGRIVVR